MSIDEIIKKYYNILKKVNDLDWEKETQAIIKQLSELKSDPKIVFALYEILIHLARFLIKSKKHSYYD